MPKAIARVIHIPGETATRMKVGINKANVAAEIKNTHNKLVLENYIVELDITQI
jgi:hypothetical protein